VLNLKFPSLVVNVKKIQRGTKMKKLYALLFIFAVFAVTHAHADDLVWQTPMGTFGLPFKASEALVGYDGINKQAVAGFSLPVWTDPKNIVVLQLGAIAPWQTNEATVQPYIGLGHDILRDIPSLDGYDSLHLNAFGRWDTGNGRAGCGLSFSYSFAGGIL
jgi:hypothetical protein